MGRPPIGKRAMTAAERQRRHRAGQTAKPAPAFRDSPPVTKQSRADDGAHAARLRELEAALQNRDKEIAALKAEIADTLGERFQRAPRNKPKAEKPPLPPDEARDRRIKALTTENQNLKRRIAADERHYKEAEKRGVMGFKAIAAISKALHPEHEPTKAERADAIRHFNAWKADANSARRRKS